MSSSDEDSLFGGIGGGGDDSDSDDTAELIQASKNSSCEKKKKAAQKKKAAAKPKDDSGGLFDSDSDDSDEDTAKAQSKQKRMEALAAVKKPSATDNANTNDDDSYGSETFERTADDDNFIDAAGDADGVHTEATGRRYKESNNKNKNANPIAQSIEQHLLHSQPPARRLGIRVDDYSPDQQRLSLSAPLHPHNINVHGTAFAGSLYSVAVLASYYLGRQWLLDQGILTDNDKYQLVARSGSIQYRRPVTSQRCVATSTISMKESTIAQIPNTLHNPPFQYNWNIDGAISASNDDAAVICCTYSIQLCIYDPVAKQQEERQQKATKEASGTAKPSKKPLSGYMLFCKENRAKIKQDNPTLSFGGIGKELEKMWRALTDEEKGEFKDRMGYSSETRSATPSSSSGSTIGSSKLA